MSGIEFVDDASDDDPSGAVDGAPGREPPRRRPRRLFVLWTAAALAAAGVVLAVVRQDPGTSAPRAAPSTTATPGLGASSAPDTTPGAARLPVEGTAPNLAYAPAFGDSTAPVLDVAVSARRSWVLQPGRLYSAASDGPVRSAPVGSGLGFRSARLLVDEPADVVWLVFGTDVGVQVDSYRASTLSFLAEVRRTAVVAGAAALDGKLFLSTGRQLLSVTPRGSSGAATATAVTAPFRLGEISADPSRHRLLVVSAPDTSPGSILAFVPRARTERVVATGLLDPALAVAGDGAIWLSGGNAAVVRRLDPATLQPDRTGRQAAAGTVATVVSAGTRVVWVLVSDQLSAGLACVDATTGAVRQTWSLAGPVASKQGTALVATSAGVRQLQLGGCEG